MKHRQRIILGLFISAFSLVMAVPVQAEPPKVTPIPTTLAVTGKRCLIAQLDCTTVKRNLLLRSNQAVTDIKIFSVDLNRTDGAEVFPATAIKVSSPTLTSPTNQLQSNQPLTIPIEFNLSKVPSGEFSGNLLVIYGDREQLIPVTVKIQDHWLWALLVLLLGVGLGMAISAYRAEGVVRDEVLVKVGRLRHNMRSDEELNQVGSSFKKKVDAYLVEVETALENKRWQAAEEAVVKAQAVWDKWRKSKEYWIELLKSESDLDKRIKEKNPEQTIRYLEELSWQLDGIQRETANQESPADLSKSLQEVQKQFNQYLDGEEQLQKFNELREKLSQSAAHEIQEAWRLEALSLQQQLDKLSPNDREKYEKWQEDIKTKSEDLAKAITEQPTNSLSDRELQTISRAINTPTPTEYLRPVLIAPYSEKEKLEQSAPQRLRWFNRLSYVIAIILLGGAGFTQLYAANSTFGANGLTAYFALLAWGFGAEATRETVTKALQDWNLPGLKSKN